jgi:hypothetical protein
LPEIWLMVGVRLGLTAFLVLAVLIDDLRQEMPIVALIVVAGLGAAAIQAGQSQTETLRRQTLVDLVTVLAVLPLAVLNGFVAADSGSMTSAEHSALFQTFGGLLLALAVVIGLGALLFPRDRILLPAILLPALTLPIAVSFVLHDYRNQTVIAMVAVSYFIGAAAIALGAFVDDPVRRYVPAIFYGSTILGGLALFDPGLGDVFNRDGLVQAFTFLLILIGIGALILIPNPSLINEFRSRPGRSRPRRENRSQRRSYHDSGGNAAS